MAKSKSIVGKIIAVILVLCLVALVVGVIAWLTNGLKDNVKTFGIKIGDTVIVKNTDYIFLRDGDTIELITLASDTYDVQIYAKKIDPDITIPVGAEIYTWNDDVAGTDMTEYFGIEKRAKMFTLNYGSLAEVFSRQIGIKISSLYSRSDVFEMIITSGGSTITLGFTVCLAEKLELDFGYLVF